MHRLLSPWRSSGTALPELPERVNRAAAERVQGHVTSLWIRRRGGWLPTLGAVAAMLAALAVLPMLAQRDGREDRVFAQRLRESVAVRWEALQASQDGTRPSAVLLPGGVLALSLLGSSSCPARPTKIEIVNPHALRISVETVEGETCTADLGTTTSEVDLDPDKVDLSTNLDVTLARDGRAYDQLKVRPAGQTGRPGAEPADPRAAMARIRAAYAEAFIATDLDRVLAAVDGGAELRGTVEQLRRDRPEVTATRSVTVGEILFVEPGHAALLYDVVGGDLRGDDLLGEAVLTAAGWQVQRRTFCGVLGAAGARCPDQPG
ncbi:hypothetical protein [Parafrankia sp. EUN1f]|uniref:hypothetical protein n=1 Tax=Parafrankia sp. EUN1f TaxID=102897 RepID=UPI0001C4576D|nr:hypothetical protein [Parafrankia sp. EUN1f]EFC82041.1 hypothetical protein FrEUN1fDRAFT_4859 [Parafrankia sp. EUN1f]